MLREKMKISDRAKIFAPFDALKGYKEALHDKEEIYEEKKELSSDIENELSLALSKIKIGNMVCVKYYLEKEKKYIVKEGILTKFDLDNKVIVIVKEKIKMEDIYSLSIIEEKGI